MFRNTQRVADGGWRFDWEWCEGGIWKGLRYYPAKGILSSWSRPASRYSKVKFHPYVIPPRDWMEIVDACGKRWGKGDGVVVEPPKKIELEVEVAPNVWRGEEWCIKVARFKSLAEYVARYNVPTRQKG